MNNHTPTPVPSEVAETTAGEREECLSNTVCRGTCDRHSPIPPEYRAPAEPDAGEVEALAKVIERAERPLDESASVATYGELAQAVLASDWLAAHDDRVRREEGERIAQAIEADRERWYATEHPQTAVGGHAYTLASRIARAASVGRGEGL